MIYHLSSTTSTNDDAKDLRYVDGDIVWADFQTAGRGQRGHSWESRKGENLTFSVVLEPSFLPVAQQFLLLEAVSLSLVDFFDSYGIRPSIKWTNDIYVDDRKLVGILIEHLYTGATLSRTIVGIGINVNQREFSPDLPNPVSMALLTGREFDLAEVLSRFEGALQRRYAQLRSGEWDRLQADYHARLYRRDEWHRFALPDGSRFEGAIRGVKPMGDLIIEHRNGEVKSFLFKEVEFIIAE
jgi:BirA family biotin operon repressor/biotin-[acetyl-CoA-carboxylase] ligase